MNDYRKPECFMCRLCGHDVRAMAELYMVWDDLWNEVTWPNSAGMLCIGCFEDLLGRKLTGADFTPAPLNDIGGIYHAYPSLRMRDRLRR